MRVHGRKLRGPAEELIGVVTASHDVTALRARESELSARVRDVEALAEASRAILGAGDAGKAACEAVQTLCGAQHVSLVVPSGDALVTVASTSANLSGFELPIDPESSVVGTAYAQRKPTFINVGSDPRTAPRAIELLRAEYGPVGSALYMPLVHEDECLGVLLMTSAHELGKLPGRIFGLLEIVTAELGTRLERDRLRSELAAQASTDPLTGLANRRSWDERVGHAVIAAGKAPLCMAILDLDHFKLFNDTHGHQAGDLLLREVAAAWSAQIRSGDLLARLGGEEFGLMLPGCTVEDAMPVLNAVRLAVPQGQTVSIGLSQRRTDETVSTWYARTDQALYRAKAMGRDRVQTDADGFVERRQHPPIPTQAEVPEPTGESRTP
jgi:diguanylate cyclase (GGDEF)-like protein